MEKPLPKVQMQELIGFILLLVVVAIVAMIGLNIEDNLGDTLAQCNAGFSYNSTNEVCFNTSNASQALQTPINLEYNTSVDTKSGISNLTAQFPNIGLVIAAIVIIGLLIGGFAFAFKDGGGF